MNQRTFAYVCAPTQSSHVFKVHEYCRLLFDLGYLPIATNTMFSQFLNDNILEHREARRNMALSILRRCRVLIVCSDEVTQEMEAEIMLAKRLGIISTTLAGLQKISAHAQKGASIE